MKSKLVKCLSILLSVTVTFGLSGCSMLKDRIPPVSEVQNVFYRDKEILQLLKDYFIATGYADLYVYDDCKTALAGLEKIIIDDQAVVTAFQQLRKKGYEIFDKNENTIKFETWSGIRDVSAGIAYSVDGTPISIEYMTECEQLSEPGWYYYVTDYNKARLKD